MSPDFIPMQKSFLAFSLLFILSICSFAQRMGESGEERDVEKPLKIKLVKKNIGGFLNVALPKDFTEMGDEDIAKKYPSYIKPLILFGSEDRNIDFGFNISRNIWGNDLKMLKLFYKASIVNLFQKVSFIQDTVATINSRQYVLFEFISEAENKEMEKKLPSIKNYSYFLYSVEKNRILVVMFNSPARLRKKWSEAAANIIQSLALNTNELDEKIAKFNENKMKKGKAPKEVLVDMKEPKKGKIAPADSAKKPEGQR